MFRIFKKPRFLSLLPLLPVGWMLASVSTQAADFASALSAFDLYGKKTQKDIVGMVGFYGEPAPSRWLVLSPLSPGRFLETVVSRGALASERTVRKLPGQDLPDIPIERDRVRIDSGKAFEVAEAFAKEQRISFESAHYHLRCRDREKEPVWLLSLIDRFHVEVAAVYLSAESGEILRTRLAEPQKYSSESGRKEKS